MSEEKIMRGNIQDLPLIDIIQILASQQKTGTLIIEGAHGKGLIVMQKGRVVYAISPLKRVNLTEILLRKGILSDADFSRTLQLQRDANYQKRLSEILVEEGFITEKQLQETIILQIEDAIHDLVSWTEGSFAFELDHIFFDNRVAIDTENLALSKGVSTRLILTRLNSPSDEQSPLPTGELLSPRTLSDVELATTDTVKGPVERIPESDSLPGSGAGGNLTDEGGDTTRLGDTPDDVIDEDDTAKDDEADAGIILVCDDEAYFRRLIVDGLQKRGFSVIGCSEVGEALSEVAYCLDGERSSITGAILDVIMPETEGEGILGGFELLNRLMLLTPDLDIIMISSTGDPELYYKARELGARHFVSKPSSRASNFLESRQSIDLFIDECARLLRVYRAEKLAAQAALPARDAARSAEADDAGVTEAVADIAVTGPPEPVPTVTPPSRPPLPDFSGLGSTEEILTALVRYTLPLCDGAILLLSRKDDFAGVIGYSEATAGRIMPHPFNRLRVSGSSGTRYATLLKSGTTYRGRLGESESDEAEVIRLVTDGRGEGIHCIIPLRLRHRILAQLHLWSKLTSLPDDLITLCDSAVDAAAAALVSIKVRGKTS